MEAIVEYNYVAQEPDELTLRKGDIVKEIKVMLGGWWEGTLRDKRGMFPDNFVKVLEPTGAKPGSAGAGQNDTIPGGRTEEVNLRNGGSARRWCRVLFGYEPCNQDELALVQDDFIEYLGEVEEGWWRGRLRGRLGVFPSNFVTPPIYEEPEKHKDRDKKELCRVLFSYEADNEDELTLVEGDIITLLSRDAPDKGWWKGELRGQVGLFPDNFVEVIGAKEETEEQEHWHEGNVKSAVRHSHQTKKSEKTSIKKSLDVRNSHTEHFINIKSSKKTGSSSSSSASTSPAGGPCTAADRKISAGTGSGSGTGHSIISSLKRLVADAGHTNNGNGAPNVGLGEELDGVERGEGAPLSHLTASRAKAPRRRPPSSQRLRRYPTGGSGSSAVTSLGLPVATSDDNLANGSTDTMFEHLREEEEGLVAKARKKAPWVEELKLNQLERKKIGSVDRVDKPEVKKERTYTGRSSVSPSIGEPVKLEGKEAEEVKSKERDKGQRSDLSPYMDQLPATGTIHSPASSGTPAYVPYPVYSQLLDRVATLEEKQSMLQQTLKDLYDRVIPLLNVSVSSKE